MFPVECPEMKEACQRLSELIKIDTTNPPGNEIKAAEYCKKWLEKEGFKDIAIIESAPGRGNVICRWKGSDPNAKSLLLLAHLDVVPADASNWERDPFGGDIEAEHVWGRGTLDCKGQVMCEAMACIILKRKGFIPKGDIIMAFTADEEQGGEMGVGYLVREHWDKIKADYIINEGGGFMLPFGKDPKHYIAQIGEKGVFETKIRVQGRGGHASMLVKKKENAMLKISRITQKIIEYKYPIEITAPVIEMANKMPIPGIGKRIFKSKRLVRPALKLLDKVTGENLTGIVLPLVMDILNPTGLKASEKVNVIPQYTEMTFDCRLLPNHDRTHINKYLRKALGKKLFNDIEIIGIEPTQLATVNTSDDPLWDLVEKIIGEMHEDAKLIPMLSSGSTDSKFFRAKGSYALGFCPLRMDPNMTYAEMLEMAHGKNERMWIPNISYGIEFFYRLVSTF